MSTAATQVDLGLAGTALVGALVAGFLAAWVLLQARRVPRPDNSRGEVAPSGEAGAEQRIALLQQQTRKILDSVAEGVIGVDAQGRTTFVNPAATALLGWSARDLLGSPVHHLVMHSGEAGQDVTFEGTPLHTALMRGETTEDRDLTLWRRDRTSIKAEAIVSPIREQGRITGAVIVFRDVTEERRRERQRRIAERRWRSMAKHVPEYLSIVDRDGTIRFINRAAPGVDIEDVIGTKAFAHVPDDEQRRRMEHAFERAFETGEPQHFEVRGLGPDGGEAWYDNRLGPVPREGGAPDEAVLLSMDVTERRLEEERFRSLLESAPDAMVIVDGAGTVQVVNEQAERLFGYPRDELVGERVETLVPMPLRERHVEHRASFMAAPRRRPMGSGLDLHAVRKDGKEVPVEISLSPMRTDGGTWVIAAVRDVTEEKAVRDLLRRSEERLRNAQALTHVGSWEWDIAADEVVWSDEMYRLYGLDPGSRVDFARYLEGIHADDRALAREVAEQAVRDRQGFAFTHRVVRPDGTVLALLGRGRVVVDAQGHPVRMHGTGLDITELEEGQAILAGSRPPGRVPVAAEERAPVVLPASEGAGPPPV